MGTPTPILDSITVEAATTLRDALVPLVQAHGQNPLPAPWDQWVPVQKVEADGYSVVFGGPFTTYGGGQVEAFHMFEVHQGEHELLVLKWIGAKSPSVERFERGAWEQEVFWALSALTAH